jgi:hypothetical protein
MISAKAGKQAISTNEFYSGQYRKGMNHALERDKDGICILANGRPLNIYPPINSLRTFS